MEQLDDDVGDLLRLVFSACHPVLATEARVALTLRMLGGLTTAEIATACNAALLRSESMSSFSTELMSSEVRLGLS